MFYVFICKVCIQTLHVILARKIIHQNVHQTLTLPCALLNKEFFLDVTDYNKASVQLLTVGQRRKEEVTGLGVCYPNGLGEAGCVHVYVLDQ